MSESETVTMFLKAVIPQLSFYKESELGGDSGVDNDNNTFYL